MIILIDIYLNNIYSPFVSLYFPFHLRASSTSRSQWPDCRRWKCFYGTISDANLPLRYRDDDDNDDVIDNDDDDDDDDNDDVDNTI